MYNASCNERHSLTREWKFSRLFNFKRAVDFWFLPQSHNNARDRFISFFLFSFSSLSFLLLLFLFLVYAINHQIRRQREETSKMFSTVQKTYTSKAVEHFENFQRQSSSSTSFSSLQKSRSEVISNRGYKPSDIHDPQAREYLNNLTKKVFHTVRTTRLTIFSCTLKFFPLDFFCSASLRHCLWAEWWCWWKSVCVCGKISSTRRCSGWAMYKNKLTPPVLSLYISGWEQDEEDWPTETFHSVNGFWRDQARQKS